MIQYIIQIADLHIRSGNTEKSRFDEYQIVFNRIIEDLKSFQFIKKSIIIISGDLFHNKLKIESPGLKLSLEFINNLSKLTSTYIIRGNHDYLQAFPDEPDLINSLLSIEIPNVVYLNKTEYYKINNLGIGLVSIQDALFSGNTSGITQDLPPFPVPDPKMQYNIALFHGPVTKAKLPNGQEINELHSYPLEWFKEYDYILLGDIHLQQINNAKEIDYNMNFNFKNSQIINSYAIQKNTWGYPGSTIQQDFGENLLGHGFLIWNLENKIVNCYHTNNDYGFITLKFLDQEWLIQIKNKWLPLIPIFNKNWFPKNVYLRVKSNYKLQHDVSINKELYNLFDKYNTKIIEIRQDYKLTKFENDFDQNNNIDLSLFNNHNVWIEFLSNKIKDDNINWRSWFTDNNNLILPINDNINKNIIDKIKDKNNKFNKCLNEYHEICNSQINLIKKDFFINFIEWDYILCYRNNNYFNFNNLQNNINSITAKNALGKTSFLETICIALFGEGFPSRNNKTYSSSIICQEKPNAADSKTSIHINIGNQTFIINRIFSTQANDNNKILCVPKYTTLEKITNSSIQNIHSGKSAVDSWVKNYIGTIDSFLLSSMISQNIDMDFFSLKSNDQKELLDNALNITVSTKFHILLKESKLNHNYMIETIKTFLSSFDIKNINYQDLITSKELEIKNDIEKYNIFKQNNIKDYNLFNEDKAILQILIDDLQECTPENIINNNFDINNIQLELNNLLKIYNPKLFTDQNESLDSKLEKYNIYINSLNTIKNNIILFKQEYLLLLKSQPPHSSKSIDELDDYNNQLNLLQNKYNNYNNITQKYNNYTFLLDNINNELNEKLLLKNSIQLDKPTNTLNEYIIWKESYDKLNGEIIEYIDENEIKQLQLQKNILINHQIELLNDKPVVSNENLETLEASLPADINDELIPSIIEKVKKYTNKYNNILDQIKNINNLSDHPYNPDCWACKQQAWKIHKDELESKLNRYTTILNKYNKLEYLENIIIIKNKIQITKIYINWKSKYDILLQEIESINNLLSSKIILLNKYNIYKNLNYWTEDYNKIINYNSNIEIIQKLNNEIDTINTSKSNIISDINIIEKDKIQWENLIKLQDIIISETKNINKFNNWKSNIIVLENNITKNEQEYDHYNKLLLEISEDIDNLKIKENINQLQQIINSQLLNEYKLSFELWEEWHDSIVNINEKITNNNNQLILLQHQFDTYKINQKIYEEHNNYLVLLQNRFNLLNNIYNEFSGFSNWLYTTKVIPSLIDYTNHIIKDICDNRPLYLECIINNLANGSLTFDWFIKDGLSQPPIEKASGFQRFIIGLAIRIALGSLGGSGIKATQLFIDEGWTSADSDNLLKVNDFLEKLLDRFRHILIVSHLQEITDCAKNHIKINRSPNETTSQLQFGEKINNYKKTENLKIKVTLKSKK
jgi:DNA repair exonuclease SbcCD ATPase subunit